MACTSDGTVITAANFVGQDGIEGRQNGSNETDYFMKAAHGEVIKAMDFRGTEKAANCLAGQG